MSSTPPSTAASGLGYSASSVEDHSKCGTNCSLNHNKNIKPLGPRPTSPPATPAATSYTPPKGGLYAIASGIPDHSHCGENCSLNHNQYMKQLGGGK